MAERTYLGVIERGDGSYGIVFPDFPGCISAGDTIDHVLAMGKEALTFHVEAMVEDGDLIPQPSEVTVEQVKADIPEGDWVAVAAVTIEVPTFPDMVEVPLATALVQEVDRFTSNRRQFIEDAARRELERLRRPA